MLRAVLLGLAVLTLAGSAQAGPIPPAPEPLLEFIYENVQTLETCLAASVEGSVGLRTIDDPPFVELDAPALTPPSPDCLVLP